MPINSSFPKVADQIISFNKNIIDTLSKINSLTTTTETSLNLQIYDEEGVLRNYTLPSFNSIKSELERLNNNINSLYAIDGGSTLIQSSKNNKFKKVITVDLNREPNSINSIGNISTFKSKANWFFDNMIDPMLDVEIDLSNKIEDNVRKCLVRRYIIDFEQNVDGLTNNGQSALNSFNELFRGNANIIFNEFDEWHRTTPGVVLGDNPKYDETVFDLEPNSLQFDGNFNVLQIQEDRLNKKLWYVLNTLEYVELSSNSPRQLKINDELIINTAKTSTRYKVIEISEAESNPRVRFERVEGLEPISVGVGTLKIYSPVIQSKKVRISIGYNERNIIFLKPINTENNLVAKQWSLGSGFYTNDLKLNSTSSENGLSMAQFYEEYVYDYGDVLKDLVAKKIPNRLSGIPQPPSLGVDNFKVVQINKHLTDTKDTKQIKQKYNQQNNLKSEITQLEQAIKTKSKKNKLTTFKSSAAKKEAETELINLNKKRESKSSLLKSVNQEILDLSNNPVSKSEPKFRVRGFWNLPEPTEVTGSKPQEIIQFRVQYRYVSKDGAETPTEQFTVDTEQQKASFSNWIEYKTEVRNRIYDSETESYYWEESNLESSDVPNINQIDLPIQSGERVEFRVKSISEVGWPESPVESPWSEIMTMDFPDDLNNVINERDLILQETNKEDLKNTLNSELASKGLDDHLADTITFNNKTYYHDSNNILSGFTDANGNAVGLYDYLVMLTNKYKELEEKISRARGILQVTILKGNEEIVINNGSETTFNIECEDYLSPYLIDGVENTRVYENGIYSIKEFSIKVSNVALNSDLGLLSNRVYLQNGNAYNQSAPQTFWVNSQDEILKSDVSGQTRTHLDNQFIWMVNYDSITDESVSKLSDNVGNSFVSEGDNSLTDILSSSEYNLGYSENSVLSFVGNNNSLLDPSKWIDNVSSVASTTKLLSTIHPSVSNLEYITETNSDKTKTLKSSSNIIIPLNIYFKMNSLDTNQSGINYEYIDLSSSTETVKHSKKVKFFMENEAENRPFVFSIKFNLNRNKVILAQNTPTNNNTTTVNVNTPFNNNNNNPFFSSGSGGFSNIL